MSRAAGFTVTAPGERERRHPAQGVALSNALTLACRASAAVTIYVRNPQGDVVHRVERDEAGVVTVPPVRKDG